MLFPVVRAHVTNNSQYYSYTLSIYFPNDTTFCDLHIFTHICKTKIISNPLKQKSHIKTPYPKLNYKQNYAGKYAYSPP